MVGHNPFQNDLNPSTRYIYIMVLHVVLYGLVADAEYPRARAMLGTPAVIPNPGDGEEE
jgi:hypothetical protein